MGGSALVIYGNVSADLLQPRVVSRSIVDRLLRRADTKAPSWTEIGRDRRMADLPAKALKPLSPEFRDFVRRRFDEPWPATSAILDYLALGVTELYVRGEASGDNSPEWYVQISFSGCAGMAEVSAELATHWAGRWYRSEQAAIVARHLRPFGFEPTGRLDPDDGVIFVPFGTVGYARYHATPLHVGDNDFESRHFEIDASATENLDEEGGKGLRHLDATVPVMLPKGSCCCQWCAPDFESGAIERLLPFR